MPAIVTHDTFGKRAHERIRQLIGSNPDCVNAFLLGNQGPDPLFYAMTDPTLSDWYTLGSRLHKQRTNEVLAAMRRSLSIIPKADVDIATAYALGFLCHYLLDSAVHPLVYAQEWALCDAGVPGLSRAQGSAVHATIECEFDEVVMTRYLRTTLAQFSPAHDILHASGRVLKTVSTMYLYTSLVVFNDVPPAQLFTRSVKSFRMVERFLYSRTGIKRRLMVRAEEAVRSISTLGSLSMHANLLEESLFENRAHEVWVDPATGVERTESFEDLFDAAMERVETCARLFMEPSFDAVAAEEITHNITFDGDPLDA